MFQKEKLCTSDIAYVAGHQQLQKPNRNIYTRTCRPSGKPSEVLESCGTKLE